MSALSDRIVAARKDECAAYARVRSALADMLTHLHMAGVLDPEIETIEESLELQRHDLRLAAQAASEITAALSEYQLKVGDIEEPVDS